MNSKKKRLHLIKVGDVSDDTFANLNRKLNIELLKRIPLKFVLIFVDC